jgi:starch synthase (maltosyl-transferring)
VHFARLLRENDIPVWMLDLELTLSGKLKGIVGIGQIARRIRPDVIQAVNYHSNLLTRLAYPLLPRPVRLIGCIYVEYTARQLRYERLSSWLCAALVCNTAHLQRQILSAVSRALVEHIPNGIDLERFASAQGNSLREQLSPSAHRILLFMGRVARQKSPHLLVEALGRMRQAGLLPADTMVWIAGEIEDAAEQARIDAAVVEYGLGDCVLQLPAITAPEMALAAADVVVLPSLWEGLPNVVLEALAAGRPVIVSEAANMAGVVAHGVNGWVFPTGDTDGLVMVLSMALRRTDAELRTMRVVCREAVRSFAVEAMVMRYEALYGRLSARL